MAKAPPKEKEQEQEAAENAEGAAAPKAAAKKKKLMLAIIAVVLLAVCGGGTFAVMHFLGNDKTDGDKKEEHAQGEEAAAQGEHAEGEESKPAHAELVYFPFEPAFLTNFVVNGRPRYLQLSMTVASRDKETLDALQKHMPLVRNRVVMLLSSEQFDVLRTRPGREALIAKITDAMKEILQKETGKAEIEKILFTNYVMQ